MPDPRETPAMQQYYRFKKRHPGCVLFFRIGDFYEMFDDDAVLVSKAIGLTLTQRTAGVPMCGVPHHQLETYLKKLIDKSFRVAVCEQIEPSETAKGLVARAVTRVLTPGTLVDGTLLEDATPIKLAAILFTGSGEDSPAEIAVVDASTGQFTLASASGVNHGQSIIDELMRRSVRELLYAAPADNSVPPRVKRCLDALGISGTPRPAWQFRTQEAREALIEHFKVKSLAGFGVRDDDAAIPAAGAIVRYLAETQTAAAGDADAQVGVANGIIPKSTLAHLRPPTREHPGDWMTIDAVSLRALEVERVIRAAPGAMDAGLEGSLLGVFLTGPAGAVCKTAMGKRLLREWLCRPARTLGVIEARHAAVAGLKEDRRLAGELRDLLAEVPDAARIAGRVALGRATPRDVVALARGLARGPSIAGLLEGVATLKPLHTRLAAPAEALRSIALHVLDACVEEPPPHLREGGLIKNGIDKELDEARTLQTDAGHWLVEYQERLLKEHSLPGLKVGYNKIFGYYIELTAAQARSAPAAFTRKQTLKNAERYITPELHEFERKVSTAESRALAREREIFEELTASLAARLAEIAAFADAIGELDVLLGFAEHAARTGWVRPEMTEANVLTIHDGRHPVLERTLGRDFVPNDVEVGGEQGSRGAAEQRKNDDPCPPPPLLPSSPSLSLITGPNMAGKSTFIRQVALITLLAHAGSFVPAARATIGLTDRIFTRIGADDALHAGQSTFMVEMTETANILHHASPRSLVILDEIGRGTSTLDGLSLAWAITEHLAQVGCRTLFATHYHELTDLAERGEADPSDPLAGRIKNLHVAVREWPLDAHAEEGAASETQIIFLHRILPGKTDQSYGIHVARLAGLPQGVIGRAREVLASLAVHHGPATGALVEPVPGTHANGEAPSGKKKPRVPATRVEQPGGQMGLFTEFVQHPAVDALRELKIESLSPLQAFDELRKLKDAADPNRR
ncbi:MAG: DNA mismatch repair protein MutS [Phycisphaerales bacterium]|nr:DNA mismatch repair protein MutS [Phycisphaerales bacterium]